MRQPPTRTSMILGLALPIVLAGFGCKKEESIRSYTAPKEHAAPAIVADVSPDTPDQTDPPTPTGNLSAPAGMQWHLPTGWKQVPVPPNPVFMPAAAIAVSADQPDVILTVSQMPGTPGARSVYANVTRWAGILKMEVPPESDVEKYVVHMQHLGQPLDIITLGGAPASEKKMLGAIMWHGHDTWVFKLSGPQALIDAQNGAFADFLNSIGFEQAGAAPAAQIAGPPLPSPETPSTAGATGLGGAQWTLPAGWTVVPGEPGGLRLATIRPSNASAEIKVSKLGIVGGGLGLNVTRWHGDVGLDPVDDEHADLGQQVKFGDQSWTIHDYTGPAKGGTREIIAMTESAGNTWYFKLVGPTDAIAKLKADFDQFVSTIRLGQ